MAEASAHPLIVRGLRKHYGKHQVLRGINLELSAGAVHGLVGLNGAGKTTTLQCILGLLPYQRGAVSVLGLPPAALHRSRGKVAVVFDEPCLHPHLTVGETLDYAALVTEHPRRDHRKLEQLLGIERYHDFKVRNLSLGNRRRTAIAQALVGEPSLIFLDEPFNGLDAGGVEDLLTLIGELNRAQGISFLLASHQLSYLERICTHMAILHRGEIVLSDRIERLLAEKQTRVRLLTDEPDRARRLLEGSSGVTLSEELASGADAGWLICELQDLSAAELNRRLVVADIAVFELRREHRSLDALFRQVTGGGANG